MIKEALITLAYALFPKRCGLCGEVILLDKKLCDECDNRKRISGELCKKCGAPKSECKCLPNERTPEFKAVIAPYYYEGSVAAGVNRFKDSGYSELADEMAERIFEHISEYYKDIHFDFITYVPITKKKENKRGYNQARLLAEGISKRMNVECAELILKIKATPQQKKSSAKQRRINLRGSFDLNESASVMGKTVLIIDDIKTTGSTLNECAYVLNAYGAEAVYAAAFCMTKKKDENERKPQLFSK